MIAVLAYLLLPAKVVGIVPFWESDCPFSRLQGVAKNTEPEFDA